MSIQNVCSAIEVTIAVLWMYMTLNDDCVLVKIVTYMQTLKHLVLLNPYNSIFMCN